MQLNPIPPNMSTGHITAVCVQKTRKHLILQYSFGRERFSDYKTNLRMDIFKGQCGIFLQPS